MQTRAGIAGFVLLSFVATGVITEAAAQAARTHRYVTPAGAAKSKYAQTHIIDVGDVPGHQIRIFELETVWEGEGPAYDGVKVKQRARDASGPALRSGRNSGDTLLVRAVPGVEGAGDEAADD